MREDIQDYILEQKEYEKTLKEIVEGIEEKFNVRMSKQNVNKFYARYNAKREREIRDLGKAQLCAEVYIRRPYMIDCYEEEILSEFTNYKIKRLLTDYEYIIGNMQSKLHTEIVDYFIDGLTIDEICEKTAYKDVKTSRKVVIDVIEANIQGAKLK